MNLYSRLQMCSRIICINVEHVFCSGSVRHEKQVFSRLILATACRYFLPPFSFQIRAGGLYLLYSLYQCQSASPPEQVRNTTHVCVLRRVVHTFKWSPTRCKVHRWLFLCSWLQIRLALKDWEEVKKFERDAVDAQHFDAVYILRQLMFLRAFHFTAMPTQVSCLWNINTLTFGIHFKPGDVFL